MSIEGKTLAEGGTPAYVTRFDGVRVPAPDHPAALVPADRRAARWHPLRRALRYQRPRVRVRWVHFAAFRVLSIFLLPRRRLPLTSGRRGHVWRTTDHLVLRASAYGRRDSRCRR